MLKECIYCTYQVGKVGVHLSTPLLLCSLLLGDGRRNSTAIYHFSIKLHSIVDNGQTEHA